MINGIRLICVLALMWMLNSAQAYGQPETDSLLSILETTDVAEDRYSIWIRLSIIEESDAAKGLEYASNSHKIAVQLDDELKKACAHQLMGRWQAYLEKYDSSRYNLDKSIELFESLDLQKALAKSFSYLAFWYENQRQFDSSAVQYNNAIRISKAIDDLSGVALYNLYLGDLESNRGNNPAAINHLEIANNYFDKYSSIDSAWISLNSLAVAYDEIGLYAQALTYYLKAYGIVDQIDDQEGKLILANNLGTIYNELGKMDEAREYYARGLETVKISGNLQDEALLLNNLSILHIEEGDTLKALQSLRRAHSLQQSEKENCDLAYSCEGLGEIMTWQGAFDSANYYLSEALRWSDKCEMRGNQTSIYRNMALLAARQGRNSLAKKYLIRSLEIADKGNYSLEKKETAKELFKYYNRIRDFKNALKYQLLYSNLKDSLFDAESTERIARMTAEYDFKREIESLEYKKMADEMKLNEELRQKEANQNSILVVLVLTTLLAATLGRSYYLVQNHNKKLTALNEEKNTLMGVVAHDLRSPLNNIKGLMALVKMENADLSPEQSHYFHLVDDTMERMRDMIDRVLDVSVVEDMKVNLNLKKVDLGETMNFVAGNFELLASKKSINIHSNLTTKEHFIFADYNYLLQVIENLLSNAIKFSESGKNIFLSIFQEEGNETMIIRDEGPGISEEDQKRLFTKFQKLSAKPTDNEQSTGLGLSIVKKFIDAMDAEISCESELGKGTSFVVKFKTADEKEKELI
ncbi:MAG: tetratricopeptide repeat-containing sensor histidine kinase [Reichenbachiella sp.]|uniref:tetratricopeptide repeat-containing sensor histidine kinase n=1 Tax=Reichenbachiella sp. TaxID=2184521 RepID=UPI003264914C